MTEEPHNFSDHLPFACISIPITTRNNPASFAFQNLFIVIAIAFEGGINVTNSDNKTVITQSGIRSVKDTQGFVNQTIGTN